ncbi:sigma factor-like helix-turn-helix DNA-binding protein [Knoellia sp. LjRoot47]|uniref:sigma factor-like helix-turn-helix DNA-binding protein n=1 Tax=Knoellia sp. LjRoot47 TaxID=3342330 RepID=UPI003ED056C2
MTRPRREVDDDFAEYVRARQQQLLHAAYLVCGDRELAERVTESTFAALLLRWPRVGDDDDPDAFTRRVLHRAALTARVPRGGDGHRSGTSAGGAVRAVAADRRTGPGLPPELAALTRRERAVAVLRRFEERSEAETAQALALSDSAVRRLLPPVTRDTLADAAAPLGEPDFVERSRRRAQALRRRRRRTRSASAVAVAAVVGAVVLVPRGQGEAAPPQPAPSTRTTRDLVVDSQPWDPTPFGLLGTLAQVGPTPSQLLELPRIDELVRGQLALPDVLSFGPRTVMRDLSDLGGSSAPVRAVLLRHTSDGLRAVLVRPTLSDPFVLVDSVPLVRTVDEAGTEASPLVVKAVAGDRRRVMFVQPGRVVVLDAYTGEARTFPVPDRYLTHGGWAPDGRSVLVWSRTSRWRITPETGTVRDVRRAALSVHPGSYEVRVEPPDEMRVLGFDPQGAGSSTRTGPSALSGVWGATFASGDRFATGGFLGQAAALAANQRRPDGLFQGVFAAAADDAVTPRLLIAPGSQGASVGCCEVLGWVYRDQVLVRWNTTDLLTWNTTTGALLRVATLPAASDRPVPGSPADAVAIAP